MLLIPALYTYIHTTNLWSMEYGVWLVSGVLEFDAIGMGFVLFVGVPRFYCLFCFFFARLRIHCPDLLADVVMLEILSFVFFSFSFFQFSLAFQVNFFTVLVIRNCFG